MAGFLQAASRGDMAALLSALAPDVTWYADGGGKVPAATRPIHGARNVARFIIGLARKLIPGFTTRFASANGQLAIVVYVQGKLLGVLMPHIAEGRIHELDWVLNPDKLRRVRASWH
jgi:RNA polymerase sigma-70 factor (ECF subfamily)